MFKKPASVASSICERRSEELPWVVGSDTFHIEQFTSCGWNRAFFNILRSMLMSATTIQLRLNTDGRWVSQQPVRQRLSAPQRSGDETWEERTREPLSQSWTIDSMRLLLIATKSDRSFSLLMTTSVRLMNRFVSSLIASETRLRAGGMMKSPT